MTDDAINQILRRLNKFTLSDQEFLESQFNRVVDFESNFIGDCPMLGGYFHSGNNHFFVQFTLFKYVFQMFANGRHLHIKQCRH